jgi:hypothetical protein
MESRLDALHGIAERWHSIARRANVWKAIPRATKMNRGAMALGRSWCNGLQIVAAEYHEARQVRFASIELFRKR